MRHKNNVGLLLLTLFILFSGWLEIAQPGGRDFADLTGGIVTFSTMVRIGILTIVVVGLSLLMGYAGQVSLGQAAFYGIGAYVSAIFSTQAVNYGLPPAVAEAWWWPWLLIALGMAFTGLFAWLVGKPILRLKGHYLAMATLGLGIVVFILFRENLGVKTSVLIITGGFDGLFDIPRLRIGSFALWPVERYYFFVWAVAIAVIALALNVVNSRAGRALRAIHGSEIAAETMGVDTAQFKVKVFVLSATLASLGGSLFAHFQAAVSPAPFGFGASLELVIMAAMGGMATIWGAPLGVALFLILQQLLQARLHLFVEGSVAEIETIVFGALLVILMIFLPEGVAHTLTNWAARLRRRAKMIGLPGFRGVKE
ncbi:MAG TPA: branched-chain amino acid ABC transporter permease [Anaerolineae bacterium]|nr:branched-chain amino acid ABC transporter permease [Anaerolineae bacterium]